MKRTTNEPYDEMNQAIIERIKYFMDKEGLTISGISKITGIAQSTVSEILKNKNKHPSFESYLKIIDAFECNHSEFWDHPIFEELTEKRKRKIEKEKNDFYEEERQKELKREMRVKEEQAAYERKLKRLEKQKEKLEQKRNESNNYYQNEKTQKKEREPSFTK